jgi:hypothetical protein
VIVCDVLDYIGQHLLGPILAAVIGGPLAALTFRYFGVGKEAAENDARASELDEDLRRWVRDRNRQLDNELRGIVNGAGNQLDSGSLRNKAVAAMRQALHEYRDEATGKAREFSALARAEGRWHRSHRRRRGFGSPTLGLRGQERLHLNRWRQRPYLVDPGGQEPDLIVGDDPTADEGSIAPLESEEGLTWAEAAARRTI